MKRYFPLEYEKNKLLASVANTIKEYYPIGVSIQSPEYQEYPGIKKMDEMFTENMINHKKFYEPWKQFLIGLSKRSKKKIHSTTLPNKLSFSGELILENYQDESLIRNKKLKFCVSLLGPFYSICGVDETFIKEKGDSFARAYPAINVITTSPHYEFENSFNVVEDYLKEQFPTYKLLPIRAGLRIIENLETRDNGRDECTVYNVLFDNSFDLFFSGFFRGDSNYGYDKSDLLNVVLMRPPST